MLTACVPLNDRGFFYFPITRSLSLCVPVVLEQHITVIRSLLTLCPGTLFSFSDAKVFVSKHFQNNPDLSEL